ncbi:thiamine biosynthesis protein ThiS [Endozoicomonas sp. (ex Bugula neritina AB1)]|nr:thiamine biosynthesis protein ThiS [Endozoicomonas sp. (ex Bugula neritina AB1)]
MLIKVNNQPVTLQSPYTLAHLLSQLEQADTGIALAVNRQIIKRSHWANHDLNDGDEITLIKATAGG